MTDPLVTTLLRLEGVKLEPYKDVFGWWTIGVGHLIDSRRGAKPPNNIPLRDREEAIDLLLEDILVVREAVHKELPWISTLDPVRERVLVNMAFQMGVGGLLQFKNTLSQVRFGNWSSAADGMLHSLWAKQTPARAQELAMVMRTGREL